MDDLKSSAHARAERVKRLRNLANLSRQEMCDLGDLSINTLKGWEIGRYGGISKVGANKVVKCLEKAGVYASVDWLLHEVGPGPRVDIYNPTATSTEQTDIKDTPKRQQQFITDELLLFRQHYPKSLDLTITDDALAPQFMPGDLVAGKIRTNLDKTHQRPCLVQLSSGEVLLRLVHRSTQKNCVNLSASNPNTRIETPIIYDIKPAAIAPVIWHRKMMD